jgi:hypothetical protein
VCHARIIGKRNCHLLGKCYLRLRSKEAILVGAGV